MIDIPIPYNYPTLQAAIDALKYNNDTYRLIVYEPLTHGLVVRDGDYSKFTIVGGMGQTVKLAANFVGVAEDADSGTPASELMTDGLFYAVNAKMPRLNVTIDMEGLHQDGIFVERDSSVIIKGNNGILNAGRHAVQARHSRVWGMSMLVTGAKGCGVRAQHDSDVSAMYINADNCGKLGEHPSLFISRGSRGYFNEGSARNSRGRALDNHRSWVVAQAIDLENAAEIAINVEQGGHTIASSAKCHSAGSYPINVETGATGYFRSAILTGHPMAYAIRMDRAGLVTAHSVTYTGTLSNIAKNTITSSGILLA